MFRPRTWPQRFTAARTPRRPLAAALRALACAGPRSLQDGAPNIIRAHGPSERRGLPDGHSQEAGPERALGEPRILCFLRGTHRCPGLVWSRDEHEAWERSVLSGFSRLAHACQRSGSSSSIRRAGWVLIRSSTSRRYACGSIPSFLHVVHRLISTTAVLPLRRSPRTASFATPGQPV